MRYRQLRDALVEASAAVNDCMPPFGDPQDRLYAIQRMAEWMLDHADAGAAVVTVDALRTALATLDAQATTPSATAVTVDRTALDRLAALVGFVWDWS